MNMLAKLLDEKLRTLEPARARYLESLVRKAIDSAEHDDLSKNGSAWPVGYFDETASALAGEDFERPPQGEVPIRDDW